MNFEVKNLVDYFVVCGLDTKNGLEPVPNEIYYDDGISKPPLERAYKSKVLNHFPSNLPWNPFDAEAVTQLCLPKGLVFETTCQKPYFHPFIITREDGSRVYAGTFTFFELIEDDSICTAMQSLQTMYDAENFVSKDCTTYSANVSSNSGPSRINNHLRSISASVPVSHARYSNLARQNLVNTSTTTPVFTRNFNKFSDFQKQSLLLANNSHKQTTSYDDSLSIHENEFFNSTVLRNNSQLLNDSSSNDFLPQGVAPVITSGYRLYRDKLYAPKCICLISQNPFIKSFKKILATLYDMVEQTDLLGISIESHLYNICYELPRPQNGTLVKYYIGCRSSIIHMPDYANGIDLPLFDYDLMKFFSLFKTNDIINFYVAALLEHQILLYSENYFNLMLVSESLTALFFPFTWLKPYVPIVPASNLHFIEAPVPYIMGFHHKNIDKDFFRQGQRCFIDIDSGQVTCPEDLPELPDKSKFCKELTSLFEYYKERMNQLKIRKQLKLNKSDPGGGRLNSEFEQIANGINNLNSCEEDENISNEILKNSQAFLRITEIARKVGALNYDHEYSVDKSTGRIKSTTSNNRDSGISSASSINSGVVNNNTNVSNNGNFHLLDKSHNNSFEMGLSSNTEQTASSFSSAINDCNSKNLAVDEEELINLQFTQCVRELFLQNFVRLFASYEKYVIIPNLQTTNIDSWWTSREYTGNFDSKMFLIEQPSPRLPFMSHFIATQMFASFIDLKIISIIEKKFPESNVNIFDERIRRFKDQDNILNSNIYRIETQTTTNEFHGCLDVKTVENSILRTMCQVPKQAPTVRKIISCNEISGLKSNRLFENINVSLLKADEELIKKIYKEMKIQKEAQSKKREQFENNPHLKLRKVKLREKKTKKTELISKCCENNEPTTPSNEKTEKITTELNPVFIQSLLKESKLKTKRMLVEKMPEAIHLGHGECRISGVEENMLIASLCDLIERIWTHGLHSKPGKSALWNHLNNYRKLIQYLRPVNDNKGQYNGSSQDTKNLSPILIWCLMHKKARHKRSMANNDGHDNITINNKNPNEQIISPEVCNRASRSTGFGSVPRNKRMTLSVAAAEKKLLQTPSSKQNHHSLSRNLGSSASNLNNLIQSGVSQFSGHKRAQSVNTCESDVLYTFTPIQNDLLGDLSRIDKLTEVKTEIGMARAFVRLSLEKKLLADHLRQLLGEAELLRALYKKHAFLRQEDEREQFIYHLQSLNVVDHFCFTNHFKSIPTDYSVLVIPSKSFNNSSTSANAHIKLFGSLGESCIVNIPKNTFQFTISCNTNLGPLSTLSIGHDNSGMSPKWMIEFIFVRNETTGHVHKFPCGRWLGKGVDDDSLERLLIAQTVTHKELTLSNEPSFSPSLKNNYEEKKYSSLEVQEMLGNSINNLLKFFERPESDKSYLTILMCGERGLVNSMENVFFLGFKNYKFFKKQFIWDFLEKAAYEFEGGSLSKFMNYSPVANNNTKSVKNTDRFTNTIRNINHNSANYGKDGKFQIFICLACRNNLLVEWFCLLSRSNAASQMYDELSFFRNFELNKFCIKILSITNQFHFKLEKSLTMGINQIS